MLDAIKETYVLVPKRILERARALAQNGLYDRALELLERNKLEFDVYDTFMRMRMPEAKQRSYHFKKSK